MNQHNNISLTLATSVVAPAYSRLKVVTGGLVDLAAAADGTLWIGTNLQDADQTVVGRDTVAIQGKFTGIHYAINGAATAIAAGDAIQAADSGKVAKYSAGTKIGIALSPSTAVGDVFKVIYQY
jgi:fructose-specific component phosphotransferase system IIB-like protein